MILRTCYILWGGLLALLMACSATHQLPRDARETAPASGAVSAYLVEPGDRLQINVYGHQDLSSEVTTPPDGVIAFPLIGDLQLSGKTVSQIRSELTQRLEADYLVHPMVTVQIKELVRKNKVYVLGEVRNPGPYAFDGELTAFKAISLAGGFTKKANRKRFELNRTDPQGDQRRSSIHRSEKLLPGDVIVVPVSIW